MGGLGVSATLSPVYTDHHTTRKSIDRSKIKSRDPTSVRRDPNLGFLAGRVLDGALEEPQAVGSGPRDTASTVEYLA